MTAPVVVRDDGRSGFYDKCGRWHNGSPVPPWGDFLKSIGLDPGLVPGALAVLGVKDRWSCSRSGPKGGLRIPHHQIVYYAACPGGLIKIGTTQHLYSRWTAYRGHHKAQPELIPERLLAVERGRDDGIVIRNFQDLRVHPRSEYLESAPELEAWISARAARISPTDTAFAKGLSRGAQ